MRYASWNSVTSSLFVAIYFFSPCFSETSNTDGKVQKNETMGDVLKRDLLMNYDKYARPTLFNNATTVSVGLNIKHIDLDEIRGSMTLYGWLQMAWSDKNLAWNPDDYGGMTELNLPGHEIWQPDLSAINSASDNVDHYGNTLNVVMNSGDVIWVPPCLFNIFCSLDFRLWPFDTQTCTLTLGSWSYGADDIELYEKKFGTGVEIERYVENHEWIIKEVKIKKERNECCAKPFQTMQYDITLERRSPMYETIVITPASCIILLTLSCFWLPAQAGEKILLNGINIIIICAFMMYFAQMLPSIAITTPLVVLFYSCSLILASISMIISVLVLYFAETRHHRRVPECLKKVLEGPVGTALCLFHITPQRYSSESQDKELQEDSFNNHTTDEEHPTLDQPPKQSVQHDWIVLATAIDRVFFLVYCVMFIVLAATYSV